MSMGNEKVIYNSSIKRMVINLYGENSEIFENMMNGKKISRLVKLSYKCKSIDRYKIGDKKKLFEMCKHLEERFEKEATQNCGL